VDNNSKDNTWPILLNLKEKHPGLIIEKELNSGAPSARNRGLSIAKGDWVQFLDADDLLKPEKIGHQVRLISNNHDLKLGFIAAACVKITLQNHERIISDLNEENFISPFINKCGNTCSNLWNKKALLNIGGWDQTIRSSQETDLMLRMVLAGNSFITDNEVLTIIRERESGQISQRDPGEKWKQFIEIRLKYLEQLEKNNQMAYLKHKGILYDFIMVSVLTLAKYNKQEAIKIYNDSIKCNWVSSGHYGFSKLKILFIKLVGLPIFIKLYKN
jgi:glycosyltransferase involved in cell wall biosynthesis